MMGVNLKANYERVDRVGHALAKLGISGVLALEEGDPQFIAIKTLVERLRDCNAVALLTTLNALVSYQLTGSGEEYWIEFSEYPFRLSNPDHLAKDFLKFLENSRYNRLLQSVKTQRIRKLINSGTHIEIYVRFHELAKDLNRLWEVLKRGLSVEGSEKTIVFSVKMFYYTARACGYTYLPPMNINIPVDRRVAAITYTSGIVDTESEDPINLIMRRYKDVQRLWLEVSKIAGIPPLNLDSILWICGKHVWDVNPVDKAALEIVKLSSDRIPLNVAKLVTSELFRRRIPR